MNRPFWKVFLDTRHRFIMRLSAAFVFLLFALFGYQFWNDYKGEIARAEIAVKNTSSILDENIKEVFNNMDHTLINIIDIIHERGPQYQWTPERYYQVLNKKVQLNPEASAIRVIDKDGNYIGQSNSPILEKTNIADRDYFKTQKSNRNAGFHVSKPVISRTLDIPIITLSRRIEDTQGNFNGIVYIVVPVDYFKKIISTVEIGKNGNISLVSLRDRILIARTKTDKIDIEKPFAMPEQLAKIVDTKKKAGVWSSKSLIDGYEKTFGVSVNEEYNFFITNGLAKVDYLQDWFDNLIWTILRLLITTAAIGFGLYHLLLSLERLEDQRRKASESSKIATLGEMAAGVAHEINNPLAIIKANAEAIKMVLEEAPQDKKTVLQLIEGIDTTIDRTAFVISSLRTFSNQSENQPMRLLLVKDIVDRATSLITEKLRSNDIKLIKNSPPDIYIKAHESEMLQVLISLFSNSIDSVLTKEHDRWIEISFECSSTLIKINVTDSGSPISADVAAKMWNPFFTTKPIGKGVGLGLTTSKNYIESFGGRIYLNEHSTHPQFVIELRAIPVKAAG